MRLVSVLEARRAFGPDEALRVARLHVMRGRYHDAARWLAEAEFQLRRNDPYNTMLAVRATAVSIACSTGDFDGAVAAYERLQSRVRRHPPLPAQRPAIARAARDGTALLAVAEEMAEIGALRYALEATSEGASVFLNQGRHDSARRAAARARELYIPDQGATLPPVDGLDATAVELTPRQAQLIDSPGRACPMRRSPTAW
jgi:hypothetical protein